MKRLLLAADGADVAVRGAGMKPALICRADVLACTVAGFVGTAIGVVVIVVLRLVGSRR